MPADYCPPMSISPSWWRPQKGNPVSCCRILYCNDANVQENVERPNFNPGGPSSFRWDEPIDQIVRQACTTHGKGNITQFYFTGNYRKRLRRTLWKRYCKCGSYRLLYPIKNTLIYLLIPLTRWLTLTKQRAACSAVLRSRLGGKTTHNLR